MSETTELLRMSERRLRTLFDSIDDGYCMCVMVLDDDGRGVDYRFLEINPLFEGMTGLIDPVGKTALELVPELETVWIDTYARVGLGGERLRFEQGSVAMGRVFDVFAVPLEPLGHFAIVFRDVTLQREAEAALRARAADDAFRAALGDTLRVIEDPVETQAVAARLLGEHLGASRCLYSEIDPTGTLSNVAADYHPGVPSIVGQHVLDDFGKSVMPDFRAGRAVLVENSQEDPRLSPEERAMTASLDVGAHVMMPLVKNGRTVAGLVVHSKEPRRWTTREVEIIAETAERTWASIQRLLAERDLRARQSRAELVAEILSDLEDRTTQAQVLRLVDLLVPAFADFATVETPSRPEFLRALAHRDPEGAETLRALRLAHGAQDARHSLSVVVAGQSQLISVITPDSLAGFTDDPESRELLQNLGLRSHIAVPLALDGAAGALMVGLVDPERPYFVEADLLFLQQTVQRVELILAAAHLRRQEHDIAVRLQRALLPDRVIQHPHLAIEARYEAAGELLQVGGDWYDTFTWPDGMIGVIVGDVVGHNLDSAATMGRLRAATAALATRVPSSPAAVLDALAEFSRGPDGADFVTAACVVVDPATGVLTHTSAGHPPVLVLAPGGEVVRLEEALTPPLCDIDIPIGQERPETTVQLEPGSVVLLYSDGLVERRYESIGDGIARLEARLTALASEPLAVLADRLVSETADHSAGDDDVVVACLRYTPPHP